MFKYIKRLKWIKYLLYIFIIVFTIILIWIVSLIGTLKASASKPIDAILVLGGSIRREIYVAELVKQYPDIPVLISNGSREPCIWLIYYREKSLMKNTWLEQCALNTFQNYYYTTPILEEWGVHHVKLITSATHLPRAKWMAQIHLGSHGIWVDVDLAKETGVPGNREFLIKTILDVTRSLLWAVISHFYQPYCDNVTRLVDVDLERWLDKGFDCEYQAKLKPLILQFQEQRRNNSINNQK